MVKDPKEWRLDPDLRSKVLAMAKPSPELLRRISSSSGELIGRIFTEIDEMGLEDVEPQLAGSVAKGTIAGEPDIDVFLIFPKETYKDDIERWGMEIGKRVLENPSRKYTQHPYLTGSFKGIQADIVPCLRIGRGEKLTTAVDRTPHHTEYILSKMNERLKEEAVLLKSFFKGIGVYGAEDVVRGYSGYLCELLVLLQGGFDEVIRWFSSMKLDRKPPSDMEEISSSLFMGEKIGPIVFDSEELVCEEPLLQGEYKEMFRNDPFIVIDPVDPLRNVGSPVSEQTLAYTICMSRELIQSDAESLFSPFSERPHDHENNPSDHIMDRRNDYSLPLPDGNPDIIITQARSFLTRIVRSMERMGDWKVSFKMLIAFPKGSPIDPSFRKPRYSHYIDNIGSPLLVFELNTDPEKLPPERIHLGPPFNNSRAQDFIRKWGNNVRKDETTGKLYVKVQVGERDPEELFIRTWNDVKQGSLFLDTFPSHVENQLIHEVIRVSSGC